MGIHHAVTSKMSGGLQYELVCRLSICQFVYIYYIAKCVRLLGLRLAHDYVACSCRLIQTLIIWVGGSY